jgi:ATP-dependent DNA helicase RecG
MAQIMYGDVEIFALKTKPNNKTKIKTLIIPELKIKDCYNWLKTKIEKENSKIFWVCPAVDIRISDNSDEINVIKTVEGMFQILKTHFREYKIEKLHGKLSNTIKGKIINLFKDNKIQILICSSVIEVGIDISDADIIVIENAERFGLAQLHQIRGRVGRGQKESFCLLMINNNISNIAKNRIEFFARNTDGIKIAEFDLLQRGPGEVYGNLQSGIPNFKICTIKDFIEYKEEINFKTKYLLKNGINKIPFFA